MLNNRFLLGLIVLMTLTGSAWAQPELGLVALGGQLGFANPDGPVGTAVSLNAIAEFGTLAENLSLESRLGYWSKSEAGFSLRDFILGSSVVYRFEQPRSQLTPFAGGGLSLHFLRTKQPAGIFDGTSFTDTEIGIDLRGGARYRFTEQIDFLGEILYTLGDAEQFQIKVGALFKMTVK